LAGDRGRLSAFSYRGRGSRDFNQFSLFALISVIFCAVRDLGDQRIPAPIPSLFVTLVTTVSIAIAGAAYLFRSAAGRRIGRALALLAFAAVLLLVRFISGIIMALRTGVISAWRRSGTPALLCAMLLGYSVATGPTPMMLLGAAIIVSSGSTRLPRARARHGRWGGLRPMGGIVQRRERCWLQDLIGSRWTPAKGSF